MAGLYIHIPFCRSKCPYCNFFSLASEKARQGYVDLLVSEARTMAASVRMGPFETLYLGGGTPSLLPPAEIARLVDSLQEIFRFVPGFECTLEANPDDIHPEVLYAWNACGVNRLSIGVQSFDRDALIFLGRMHGPEKAIQSVEMARRQGFGNITIDLIYGIPGLSTAAWQKSLSIAFSLHPEHLSAYALTLEPHTIYQHQVDKREKAAPPDDLAVGHYHMLRQMADGAGYVHYEISNFCKPGWISKHNSAYWQSRPYLGLGASAHSFDGRRRWWNPSSVREYSELVLSGLPDRPSETLTLIQHYNEYLMTALRTNEGVSLKHLQERFGPSFAAQFVKQAERLTGKGLCRSQAGYHIAPEDFMLADAIILSLAHPET